MQTRYKNKIKTFMFIEFDELWYGGMKIRMAMKFNEALSVSRKSFLYFNNESNSLNPAVACFNS